MTKYSSPKTCKWCGRSYTESHASRAFDYCSQKCEQEAKGKR